jgi:Amt family ammonium transporter
MSISKRLCGVAGAFAALAAVTPVWAADMVKAPDVAAQATMMNKGDVAWMLLSAVLVLMMAIPALALFYGGLVRTKNMLSVLMQVFMIVAGCGLIWVRLGLFHRFHQRRRQPFFGGLSKAFLAGVTSGTYAATFSNNVYLPEYVFVVFQMTFAMITPALIVGAPLPNA